MPNQMPRPTRDPMWTGFFNWLALQLLPKGTVVGWTGGAGQIPRGFKAGTAPTVYLEKE